METEDAGGCRDVSALSEGLSAASEARCCPQCDDGDGVCVFPYYGIAPHIHDTTGRETPSDPKAVIGSTRTLPQDQWPLNFSHDGDGCGTYTHCLACGAPNLRAKAATTAPLA